LQLGREPGEKLGISVQGGVGSRCGNPFDATDEGIFISQVTDCLSSFCHVFFTNYEARALRHKARALRHKARALRHKARALRHKAGALRHKARALRHKARALRHKARALRHKAGALHSDAVHLFLCLLICLSPQPYQQKNSTPL